MVSSVRTGRDRFDQETIGRPIWSAVYRDLWGSDIQIEYGLDDVYEHFACDVRIRKPGISFPLYGQEKTLSYYHGSLSGYDTLTVERLQKPGEQGDAFRINCGFYACAYLDEQETGFTHGGIVYWPLLVDATWLGRIGTWGENWNRDGRARAQLTYVRYRDIPQECFLWRKEKGTGKILVRPGQEREIWEQPMLIQPA